jgi:hypothetical protein
VAKSKDAEVEAQGIDSETVEMLESDVKKGKARKFILIYKGAQIKTLIVFKKGPYQTRIQSARKDGFKGDAVCGVITGSGVGLTFQLAGNKQVADAMGVDAAVDDEPTKPTKLKDFLAENNLARKPEYKILHNVSELAKPDTDDDAAAAAAGAAAAAAPAAVASTAAQQASSAAPQQAAPGVDGDGDAALAAKIKKLKESVLPRVKDAVAADPSQKEEITELLKAASTQEKDQLFGEAFESLKKLTGKVKDALNTEGSNKHFYESNLAGAETKLQTLRDHPQSAAVQSDITKLAGYLTKAKQHGGATDFEKAAAEMKKFLDEYPAAIQLADALKESKEFYETNLAGAELKVKTLKDHPQTAAVKPEVDKLAGYLTKAKEHAGNADFKKAAPELKKILDEYPAAIQVADRIKLHRSIEKGLMIRFNNFKLHQGLEAIPAPDVKAVGDKIASLDALIKARNFAGSNTATSDVRGKLDAYKIKANRHGDYVGLRNNALSFVEALEAHPNKAAITDKITTIKADLIDKSKEEFDKNAADSYEKARALLVQVEGKYTEAKTLADNAGGTAFTTELNAANLRVQELDKPDKKTPEVDGELAPIRAQIALAQKYAAAKQYPDATKLIEEIKKALTAAEKLATEQVAFKGDEKAAGDALADIDKNAQPAVDGVQKLHDRLEKHKHAAAIQTELGEIQKSIDGAKAALK